MPDRLTRASCAPAGIGDVQEIASGGGVIGPGVAVGNPSADCGAWAVAAAGVDFVTALRPLPQAAMSKVATAMPALRWTSILRIRNNGRPAVRLSRLLGHLGPP